MQYRLQFLMIFISLIMIYAIWQLIKRGLLRPTYALLWIVTAVTFVLLASIRGLLQLIARWFEVEYAPSFLFAIGLIFITLLVLNQTVVISSLARKNKILAQEHALMQREFELLAHRHRHLERLIHHLRQRAAQESVNLITLAPRKEDTEPLLVEPEDDNAAWSQSKVEVT